VPIHRGGRYVNAQHGGKPVRIACANVTIAAWGTLKAGEHFGCPRLFHLAVGLLGAFVHDVTDSLHALLDAVAGLLRCLSGVLGRVLGHVRSLVTRLLRVFGRAFTHASGFASCLLGGAAGLRGRGLGVLAHFGRGVLSGSQESHAQHGGCYERC